MAAPMSRESVPEPGAAPYGNFPNYSRFHPPEGRVSLLPQGLLRSLFPAATRPLLGLDVGCNSGVRGRLAVGAAGEAPVWGMGAVGQTGEVWGSGDTGADWQSAGTGGTEGQSCPWRRLGMRHWCGVVQTGNTGGERRRRAMGQSGNTGKGRVWGGWRSRGNGGGALVGSAGALAEMGSTGAGSAEGVEGGHWDSHSEEWGRCEILGRNIVQDLLNPSGKEHSSPALDCPFHEEFSLKSNLNLPWTQLPLILFLGADPDPSCPGWRVRRSHMRPPTPSGVFQL